MAAGRSVSVTLSAKVDGYVAGMAKAAAATKRLAETTAAASQTQAWRDASTALLAVGAAATAALGVAAKAAAEWESQFAGVAKTVDGTTEQMSLLEGQLRSMARSMPATHQEIAATAEAAGQLGVARESVADFTATMVMLGETTNLTADQAATSLAQFSNIMGVSASESDRLGATLVALGNNGASTEAEILELSTRLAGVGAQMGLSAAQVMGFANAMASVGINAEAGGTAMTLTMKNIDAAVRAGGASLESFAQVAGITGQEFARLWGTDAAAATVAFVEGLQRIQASGGDVNGVLADLGITGIRETDTLIRLAGAGTLLADSLNLAGDAYTRNSALQDEYAKRAATAEARIQVAVNNIRDAGISIGDSLLPMIADTADGVASIASAFAGLPQPILRSVASFTGFIGALGLATGGAMKAVTAYSDFRAALDALPASGQRAIGTLGRIAAAAGIVSAGLAIMSAAGARIQQEVDKSRLTSDEAANAMARLAATGETSASMMDAFATATAGTTGVTRDMTGALDTLSSSNGFTRWLDTTIMGLAGMQGNVQMIEEEFDKLDQTLVTMDQADAGRAFRVLADQTRQAGSSMDELRGQFDGYRASLEATAQSLGVYNLSGAEMDAWMEGQIPAAVALAQAQQRLGQAHVEAGASAEQQAAALENLIDAMSDAASAALAASSAEIAYHQALADVAEIAAQGGAAVDDMTGRFDLYSEAGRDAQSALDGVASAAWRNIEAMRANGASLDEVRTYTEAARAAFIDAATSMGMTADQASILADRYGLIPATVTTQVSAPGAVQATFEAYELEAAIATLPAEKRAEIKSIYDNSGVAAAMAAIAAVEGKTVFINTVYRHYAESQGAVTETSTRGGIPIATGGAVFGPGTATSDSIPAWLSNGEFVIRAAAAQRLGYERLAYMNRTGTMPAFAGGGKVHHRANDITAVPQPSGARITPATTVTQNNRIYGADPEQVMRKAGRELERVLR